MSCTCPPGGVDPECHSPLTTEDKKTCGQICGTDCPDDWCHEGPCITGPRWAPLTDDEIKRIRMRSAADDPLLQKLLADVDPPLVLTLARYWSEEHQRYLYKEIKL
jgi:hypothetical protein